ncbi:MAG: response regulator [Candidatus Omnitrophica bacterium]|nr:response regulator [Candidatus Omnitrophota bacterium]
MAKFTILLVDDEPDFREIMTVRIKSWGYDALTASNGREAVDAVKEKNPDIIILDYMMPDMDGVSALREIRKLNNNVPVIMFTAYPDERSIKGAETLGVLAYIPKISLYTDAQAALKSAIHIAERTLEAQK